MPMSPLRHLARLNRRSSVFWLILLHFATTHLPVQAIPPAAPSTLSASMTFPLASPAGTGSDAYHGYLLQWEDRSSDETGFEWFARVGAVNAFQRIGEVGLNSTQLTSFLPAFSTNTVLQFRLRAFKGPSTAREFSAFSNIAQVVIPGGTLDFVPPQNLTATIVPGDNVRLTWTDASEREDFFAVEYRVHPPTPSEDGWQFYALPYFNVKQFDLNYDLKPGLSYDFRVRGLQIEALHHK